MQVRIAASQQPPLAEDSAIQTSIERKIRLELGRHAAAVRHASISLSDADPAGTIRCRIAAQLRNGDRVEVDDAAPTVMGAAALAARRLEQRLDRRLAIERTTATRRMRRSFPHE